MPRCYYLRSNLDGKYCILCAVEIYDNCGYSVSGMAHDQAYIALKAPDSNGNTIPFHAVQLLC